MKTNEQNGSTALARTEYSSALEPTSFDEAMRFSSVIAKTGICGVKTAEDVFIRLAAGRELGFSAMQSLRQIYVIEGRPALAADAIVGLCLSSPLCEYFDLVESTPEKATWKTKRKGRDEQIFTWSKSDSDRAELGGRGTHKKYPSAMNRARAASALARIVFPDVLGGFYAEDDIAIDTTGEDMTGEVVAVAVASANGEAPKARDFREEADVLKERIAKKPVGADGKLLRDECRAWDRDARAVDVAIADEVFSFYGMIYSVKGSSAAKAPDATESLGEIVT